ncbi:UDP-N-acetylmuramoyl-tripeptide--D-alanyl-D-alanine ligase [Pseudonocardia kujensis]|uniref:UDP-N-acetylmuramoyl-tripeptide--D-alanyl-D- alanine ligase n=1 Tax=Pseudonocardia kujensis TaxID=1128675 RepID=UPI001E3BE8AB|nr:UDP-N-acetylmuramoyl-tripeptide--D-alanyl-D-alanine ligase [Pseudonocardia kujensis]MCE0768607.1 UDP-N-acetylmuramoyl-tripeptide--D-alanyl-D-alanine ligase [Pseudonocardia kujensis]
MIEMRLAEVAAVTGGRLHRATGDEAVTAVEFDSRKVGPGGLFLALPGERADGHDFAAAAVAAGASAVLAGREVDAAAVIAPPAEDSFAGTDLGDADPDGSGAAVLTALGKLARHSVTHLPELQVVGVTGSSGKTSTKDLIAAVLRPLGETVAPPGSFNNELGHPWTALRADAATRHLVLELSARGPGHIARLCRIAPPRIGVVLNVGSAHVGEFGSPEAIAQAKGELVEALPAAAEGGVAVLNLDDPRVAAMASRTSARVVGYGTGGAVRAADVRLEAGRASFRLLTPAGEAPVALTLVGEHHVGNALAAAAVALELGGTPEGIAAALSGAAAASRWRMEVTDREDGVTVVNDAYNANPESMTAALRALAAIGGGNRRTWAVLGPMAELGDTTPAAHAQVAEVVRELGVDRFVAVGTDLYGTEQVADRDAAAALLAAQVRPGDVVLVKASRSAGLDRLAAALVEQELIRQ